jgi:hypothetical protein
VSGRTASGSAAWKCGGSHARTDTFLTGASGQHVAFGRDADSALVGLQCQLATQRHFWVTWFPKDQEVVAVESRLARRDAMVQFFPLFAGVDVSWWSRRFSAVGQDERERNVWLLSVLSPAMYRQSDVGKAFYLPNLNGKPTLVSIWVIAPFFNSYAWRKFEGRR